MKKKTDNKCKETNCLESILNNFFNNGKREKLLLSRVKRDENGYVTACFTKRGNEVYLDFTEFCYYLLEKGFVTIGDLKNFVKSLENIGFGETDTWADVVDTADMIAEGEQ